MLVPAKTPDAIVKRLHTETLKVMQSPDMKDRLAGEGAEPTTSTQAEFAAFLKVEIEKWTKVVKSAGITAE